jgi:Carboxypeptidase regulatory-like domain
MRVASLTRIGLRRRVGAALTVLLWTLIWMLPGVVARMAGQAAGTANLGNSALNDAPRTVAGRVVNAVTGQPVPRVLVQMSARAMLTGTDGSFEFDGLPPTEKSVHLQATKPGFYDSLNATFGNIGRQVDLDQTDGPVELRLYPEALLTGTVTSPSGDPLTRVQVQAFRSSTDDSGQRWVNAGRAMTDSHGNFRIALSPGDYSVQILYTPRNPEPNEAILPVIVPDRSSSIKLSVLHLVSGSEQHLDLQPWVLPIHTVRLRVQSDVERANPQIQARLNNGSTFRLQLASTQTPGEYRTELPTGSYALSGSVFGPNGQEHGDSAVNVGDRDVDGVVMQFSSLAAIPVAMVVDTASTAGAGATSDNQPPGLQHFGLSFQSTEVDPGVPANPNFLMVRPGEEPTFHLAPGRYRLHAQFGGSWFVEAVSSGSTNLLTQDLAVGPGGSASPIQVTVSNQTGSLQGTLTLNGRPASAWVYLIATTPSAASLLPMRSSSEGTFNSSSLPPGSYLAVGFESRPGTNLLDPEVQAAFATRMKTVTIVAGENANLSLEAVPATELKP